jgi:hypothetical protein
MNGVFYEGQILSQSQGTGRYKCVSVRKDGRCKKALVHRLVARAFVEGHFDNATVDHINGDRTDNHPQNLEWVSRSENSRRAKGCEE